MRPPRWSTCFTTAASRSRPRRHCNGRSHLRRRRDSGLNENDEKSTAIRQDGISRKSMLLQSKFLLQRHAEQETLSSSSGFDDFNTHDEGLAAALPIVGHSRIPAFSTENSTADPWERGSWNSEASDDSSCLESDETLSSITSTLILEDEEQQFSPPHHKLEDVGITDEASKKLSHARKEVGYLRRKLCEESGRCQKAEWGAAEAAQKAKELETLLVKEMKQRKEAEDMLARQKREFEELKIQWLKVANYHESEMKLQNSVFNSAIKDMEEKLSAAYHLLSLLQSDYDKLQQERDIIVKQFELLLRREEATTGNARTMNFSEFSYSELEKATKNFDESMKIGAGGSGNVYKGFLHHTEVAIKMLNPESMEGQSEFHQEVDVLSKMRHPHLVTLIGTCAKAWAVIYEYCTNGSLEDRLACKGNTAPLKWQVRIRIAAEICSSLIFLHSNKPLSVVHGDLKPANILIDANFVSKLGDFGICRLLIQFNSTTPYRQTYPKGTLGYMDPEFLVSGELTTYCDIYAFGIVLLRLLTGRHPRGIVKEVQEALHNNRLSQIVGPTAGDWPIMLAKQLARLALSCCESKRKRRPNLAVDAWKVLEAMKKAASRSSSPIVASSGGQTCTPSLHPVSDLSGDHEGSASCCRWLHLRSKES